MAPRGGVRQARRGAGEYLRKGAQVYIEGQLRTRKWTDQAGVEKYLTEVVVNVGGSMQMLGNRRDDAQGRAPRSGQPQNNAQPATPTQQTDDDWPPMDDIPF